MPKAKPKTPEPQPSASPAEEWLAKHACPPDQITLGLQRVRAVAEALSLSIDTPLVTVGGTNGKGTVCALLNAVLSEAGFEVGCYTSPHLLHFGERISLRGQPAPEEEIVEALETVEAARRQLHLPLSYFELTTLAAAWLFARHRCAVTILEVGLGGRLDAVNVFDPTVAVVTTIALDHTEYLGDTYAAIAKEKAGICRPGRSLIAGRAAEIPALRQAAQQAQLAALGEDFSYTTEGRVWHYHGLKRRIAGLPLPALSGRHQLDNAAVAVAALESLPADYWPGIGALRRGLHGMTHPARNQVLPGRPTVVLDVAHNAEAATALERFLFEMGYFPMTRAVFAALTRKDVAAIVEPLMPRVDEWFLGAPRDADVDVAAIDRLIVERGGKTRRFPSFAEAARAASSESDGSDRILVTGSFLTVADYLRTMNE